MHACAALKGDACVRGSRRTVQPRLIGTLGDACVHERLETDAPSTKTVRVARSVLLLVPAHAPKSTILCEAVEPFGDTFA